MRIIWCFLTGVIFLFPGMAINQSPSAEWSNKGAAFYAASDYQQAEQCFLKAKQLAIEEKQAGEGELPTILFNLAAVYRAQARYGEAEPLYRQSLALSGQATNKNRLEIVRVWDGLTLLYLGEGNLSKAEEAGRQALAVLGNGDSASEDAEKAMNNLALVLLREIGMQKRRSGRATF